MNITIVLNSVKELHELKGLLANLPVIQEKEQLHEGLTIHGIGLDNRTINLLKAHGFKYASELVNRRGDFWGILGIGEKSIRDIRLGLLAKGLIEVKDGKTIWQKS
jgi:DNA-directed RNA polymerase alpha subunit